MSSTTSKPRSNRAGRVRAGLALLTVLGFGTVATLAAWSDTGTQLTTFSAGSIDLKFDGTSSDNPTGLTQLALSNAKPGDAVAKSITVRNTGSVDLTYNLGVTTAVPSSAPQGTANLAENLKVTVVAGASACASSGATGGTVLINNATLSSAGSFSAAQSLAASTGSQTLCFVVTLPSTAPNAAMKAQTDATFTFTGSPA